MEIIVSIITFILGISIMWLLLRKKLKEKELVIGKLRESKIRLEENLKLFKENKSSLEDQKKIMEQEFQNIANKLFDEKSQRFVDVNKKEVSGVLEPLKEKITAFEKQFKETYDKDVRERISLKTTIDLIKEQNSEISKEAHNLATALKGDNKRQGDWGEVQLEKILQYSGLQKDVHYRTQKKFSSENLKPDFIIELPENKHIIIDSKVSLLSYERYVSSDDEQIKKESLIAHKKSIDTHIKSLSEKAYQKISALNQPDYVIMFVPIEPALFLLQNEGVDFFEKAMRKNIIVVSTTNLFLSLRMVAYMWKQENQKNNIKEIVTEGGRLYDKFVGFLEDLKIVGHSLERADEKYKTAMNKLTTSTRKGDTIIGRAEKIKELGADTSKQIPENYLSRLQ